MNFSAAMNQVSKGQIPTFQEESVADHICPDLTYQQRLYGFIGCFVLGWLLSFIGTLTLIGGYNSDKLRTFAILYVFGNVVSLCSSLFLFNPRTQCASMIHPTRRWATAFYITMLIVVFSVALTKQHIALVLCMLFIQVLAGFWYSISYIPFARKIAISFMRKVPVLRECFSSYDFVSDKATETSQSLGITQKPEKKNFFNKMNIFEDKKPQKKKGFFNYFDEEAQ